MIQKIRALIVKYWDVLSYLFFGVLTTMVNYVFYLPLYNWAGWSAAAANGAAWVAAVLFAYVTNKLFVFESRSFAVPVVTREALSFFASRIASGAVEILLPPRTVTEVSGTDSGGYWILERIRSM